MINNYVLFSTSDSFFFYSYYTVSAQPQVHLRLNPVPNPIRRPCWLSYHTSFATHFTYLIIKQTAKKSSYTFYIHQIYTQIYLYFYLDSWVVVMRVYALNNFIFFFAFFKTIRLLLNSISFSVFLQYTMQY